MGYTPFPPLPTVSRARPLIAPRSRIDSNEFICPGHAVAGHHRDEKKPRLMNQPGLLLKFTRKAHLSSLPGLLSGKTQCMGSPLLMIPYGSKLSDTLFRNRPYRTALPGRLISRTAPATAHCVNIICIRRRTIHYKISLSTVFFTIHPDQACHAPGHAVPSPGIEQVFVCVGTLVAVVYICHSQLL